jgi:hypothetical protein
MREKSRISCSFDNLMEKELVHKKKFCLFALAHVATIV